MALTHVRWTSGHNDNRESDMLAAERRATVLAFISFFQNPPTVRTNNRTKPCCPLAAGGKLVDGFDVVA